MIGSCPECNRRVKIVHGGIQSHTRFTGWLDHISDCRVKWDRYLDYYKVTKLQSVSCSECDTADVIILCGKLIEHFNSNGKRCYGNPVVLI